MAAPIDPLKPFAAFAEATRLGDTEALLAMAAPDAVVWHNTDDTEVSMGTSNRTLRWLHRTVPDVGWGDIAVVPTPSGFVWQSLLTGSAPGGALRAHSCVVVTVDGDGKIRRIDEYLDSAAVAVLGGD